MSAHNCKSGSENVHNHRNQHYLHEEQGEEEQAHQVEQDCKWRIQCRVDRTAVGVKCIRLERIQSGIRSPDQQKVGAISAHANNQIYEDEKHTQTPQMTQKHRTSKGALWRTIVCWVNRCAWHWTKAKIAWQRVQNTPETHWADPQFWTCARKWQAKCAVAPPLHCAFFLAWRRQCRRRKTDKQKKSRKNRSKKKFHNILLYVSCLFCCYFYKETSEGGVWQRTKGHLHLCGRDLLKIFVGESAANWGT